MSTIFRFLLTGTKGKLVVPVLHSLIQRPEPGTVSGAGDAGVGVAPEPGTPPTPAYGTTPVV